MRVSLICFGATDTNTQRTLPPLQGEGRGGDGVEQSAAISPIPLPTSPLKGEERFTDVASASLLLNGLPVARINADLTAARNNDANVDIAQAVKLSENAASAYVGIQKTGPFEIEGNIARQWLKSPNPHGLPNANVVKPWFNGLDVTRRNRDYWIVDFGVSMQETDASLFELPVSKI